MSVLDPSDWIRRRPCAICGHDVVPSFGGAAHGEPRDHVPFGDCMCGSPEWPAMSDLLEAAKAELAKWYGTKEEGDSELTVVLNALELVANEQQDQYLLYAVSLVRNRLAARSVEDGPSGVPEPEPAPALDDVDGGRRGD